MGPSRAETARTLLHGRLPARVRLAWHSAWWPVVHATDCCGQVLLLVGDGSELASALGGRRVGCVAAVVSAGDVPPLPDAPARGRARVAGRLVRLAGAALREAVTEFAQANPSLELELVGRGASLYEVEVQRVRWEGEDTSCDVDVDEYMQAWPDPLHHDEKQVLLELRHQHALALGAYLARRLEAPAISTTRAPLPVRPLLPVRVDRHGFTVDLGAAAAAGQRWVRVDFPRPVTNRFDLTDLLSQELPAESASATR